MSHSIRLDGGQDDGALAVKQTVTKNKSSTNNKSSKSHLAPPSL
jgi:hypothetical protein